MSPAICALAAPLRRAWLLDVFRIVVSAALVAHFGRAFVELPGLVGADGIVPGRPLFGLALDAITVRVASGAAVALAAAVLLGLAPRPCAALLCVLALGLRRSTFELTTLDDYVATVSALWLLLLPIGHSLSMGRTFGHTARQLTVEGRAAFACGLMFALLQLDVALWGAYAPRWPSTVALNVSFVGLGIGLFAPAAALRALAAVGISILHASLWICGSTGLQLAHVVSAAGPLLFWSACATPERAASPWNAASVIGLWLLALTVLVRITAWAPAVSSSSLRMLSDSGFIPAASGIPDEPLAFSIAGSGGKTRALELPELARGSKARRAFAYLATTAPQLAPLREEVARRVAARWCARAESQGASGALVAEHGRAPGEIAWLDCGMTPDEPRVVMLGASQQE